MPSSRAMKEIRGQGSNQKPAKAEVKKPVKKQQPKKSSK